MKDAIQVYRFLSEANRRSIVWRENRPYILSEKISYNEQEKELHVSGYVRGAPLDPNQLIHIPNFGDSKISKVLKKKKKKI